MAALAIPLSITVERYHSLIANGTIGENEAVELIHGQLVPKMSKNPPHNLSTMVVQKVLNECLPGGWSVISQGSLTLDDSEPEPDVMAVRGELEDYEDRHPGPAETGLVVEVAGSSLSADRGVKRRLYASAAIPSYWIVNLTDRRIEAFSAPERGDYSERRDYRPGEEIPLILDGAPVAALPVSRLLPRKRS